MPVSQLKIKVCGMKQPHNILELLTLKPDYMGLIFYDKSPRFVDEPIGDSILLPDSIILTGVFVNETLPVIEQKAKKYVLKAVQLHGQETPEFCGLIQKSGLQTIKAFGISEEFDWSQLEPYQNNIDLFLFDTKTKSHGGSGQKFDWSLLNNYKLNKPYFISGGIGMEDIDALVDHIDNRLIGVDLNSKFEESPGLKSIELLKKTFKKIRK